MNALKERLAREERKQNTELLLEQMEEISRRCASRPVLDDRSDEEIIGYDEYGVPR